MAREPATSPARPGKATGKRLRVLLSNDARSTLLGLTLIKGMQRTGNSYENGTIMDPRDGSVYSALMKLSPDGQKLEVRGYLGISFLGRSQIWNRLPDNALAPPAAARAAPKGGAQKKQ